MVAISHDAPVAVPDMQGALVAAPACPSASIVALRLKMAFVLKSDIAKCAV